MQPTEETRENGVGGNHRGVNMQVYSGKPFYPNDPRPEDINIEDIAHSLSNQCRFNGHTHTFYSVAEHSVLVAKMVKEKTNNNVELVKQALMHDAPEAYVGDVIRPLKMQLKEWDSFEQPVWEAICKRYNIQVEFDPIVHEMDYMACAIEKRDVMTDSKGVCWGTLPKPNPDFRVYGLSPEHAKEKFLNYFYCLFPSEAINGGRFENILSDVVFHNSSTQESCYYREELKAYINYVIRINNERD